MTMFHEIPWKALVWRNDYLKNYFIIYIITSIFKSFKKSFILKMMNWNIKGDTIWVYKMALEKVCVRFYVKVLAPQKWWY